MNNNRYAMIIVALCVVASAAAALAEEDPLTPPGSPTSKEARLWMLNQRESRKAISELPYLVTEPGSYFLTGTLYGSNGFDGVTVNSDDVELDLNGFSLAGRPGTLAGVNIVGSDRHNITIRNGVIKGWEACGVNGSMSHDSTLENLKIFCNGYAGVLIGQNALVRECTAYGNGYKNTGMPPPGNDDGIRAGPYSTVQECKSRQNKGAGIYVGMGSKVTGSTASQNQANGIFAENYCTVRDCTVMENRNGGITVMNKCRIESNTCADNKDTNNVTTAGILVIGTNNRIEDNNVTGNNYGILVPTGSYGNLVMRNSASGNTVSDYMMSTTGGDHYGAILDSNRLGESFSNSNPWANFRY